MFRVPRGTVVALSKLGASTRGRTAKAKGAAFEKCVAAKIATALNLPLTDVVRSRTGRRAADIALSARARQLFPHHVECKNHKTLSLPAWLRQAEVASRGSGLQPIVVFKMHGDGTPYVVMELDYYLHVLRKEST